MIHKLLRGLGLAALLVATGPAVALAEGAEHAEHAEHEEEAHGIVNWWSWDYGEKPSDPSHRGWPPPFGFALINFGIFLLILKRFAGKPIASFLQRRHELIANALNEASELRAAAAATLAEYEKKVAGLEVTIDGLLTQLRGEAEQEKARIIANAEAEARRLKEDAERQIAAEIDQARRELRHGVIEAAIGAAGERLKGAIGGGEQHQIAERYVVDFEGRARAGRPS